MSNPSDHLVRTAAIDSAVQALSARTGLSRLNIEMHRLEAAGSMSLPPVAERFVYVLEGSGSLQLQPESAAPSAELGSGDFVVLTPAEGAELTTERGISILLGRGIPPQDRPAHPA